MGNTLKLEDLLKPDCVPDESAGGENWRILHGDTLKLVKGFPQVLRTMVALQQIHCHCENKSSPSHSLLQI